MSTLHVENTLPLDEVNFTQGELLSLLARLQGELEAKEIAIASLKCEKKYLIYSEAKFHRYFLEQGFSIEANDAILALQRDNAIIESNCETDSEENCSPSTKAESNCPQKLELSELINAQKRVHELYREQLKISKMKYIQVCNELDEERKKHERDAAQGDDVVAMLEKERERLQTELEHERAHNRRLEKELKKALDNYAEQHALTQRQRIVAANLIKDRRRLLRDLSLKCQQVERFERSLDIASSVSLNDSKIAVTDEAVVADDALRNKSLWIETFQDVSGTRNPHSPQSEKATGPSKSLSVTTKPNASVVSSIFSPSTSRVNGCPSSSALSSHTESSATDSNNRRHSSPLSSLTVSAKLRPEPPVRRTPESIIASLGGGSGHRESNGSTVCCSVLRPQSRPESSSSALVAKISALEVETSSRDERASTPSPPPPPPMQLHYPYPGMQGNTHYPPMQNISPSQPSRHYTTSYSSVSSASTVAISPTSGHHFPTASPGRGSRTSISPPFTLASGVPANPSRGAANLRLPNFGARKSTPVSGNSLSSLRSALTVSEDLSNPGIISSVTPNHPVMKESSAHSVNPSYPTAARAVLTGRSPGTVLPGGGPSGVGAGTGCPGHLYINGK